MPEVLLSNDDVTVLGPPEIVELQVDVGATGVRGSKVFFGAGNPNSIDIGSTPLLNDTYINISPGENYSYLYQYVSEAGANTWVEVLKMNPTIYSLIHTTTYNDGIAQITIPISNITSRGINVAGNFNVQYSIAHTNPVASSMSIPALAGAETSLVINFKAVEHTTDSGPSEWIDLDDVVTTHLFISLFEIDES